MQGRTGRTGGSRAGFPLPLPWEGAASPQPLPRDAAGISAPSQTPKEAHTITRGFAAVLNSPWNGSSLSGDPGGSSPSPDCALDVSVPGDSRAFPGEGMLELCQRWFYTSAHTPEMDPKHSQHQNLPCFIFFSSQLIPLFRSAVQSRAELTWKQIITLKKLSTRNNSTHS